ncbi:hypothetical protein [Paraliobacillus sediminis]|uniref:hypothetical protein n=1 Tax=Paraliobacillus sediminis TaxID=1885916 RepID=UPI0013C2C43B|nr:hypothetical protein [Paraliobacillus sediminis]
MNEMKSVIYFDPKDSIGDRNRKFNEWMDRNHNSAVADKAVPNAKETRKLLANY